MTGHLLQEHIYGIFSTHQWHAFFSTVIFSRISLDLILPIIEPSLRFIKISGKTLIKTKTSLSEIWTAINRYHFSLDNIYSCR